MNQSNIVPQSAQMTVEEYLTEREMSNLPVLLVEGSDDDIVFQLIRDELIKHSDEQSTELIDLLQKLEIDTPASISSPTGEKLGNRSKVEHICDMADREPFHGILVGFVDREFREFEVTDRIVDNLNCHNQVGRLIWSRGHSIENYLFDWSHLRDGLRDYSINSSFPFQKALELFENNFPLILNYASAISLAARETSHLDLVQRSFNRIMFSFDNDVLRFNHHNWNDSLDKNQRLDQGRRVSLINSFKEYLIVIECTSRPIPRWICHGHIGINFIWSAFQACIYNICEQRKIAVLNRLTQPVTTKEPPKGFIVSWIRNCLIHKEGDNDTPMLCFEMLISQLELRGQ